MSLKFVFVSLVIVISTQITGCSYITMSQHSANTGKSRVTVGEVEVRKSLEYVGDTIDDTLIVSADENGNGIISAGKGKLEITPLILNNDARTETIDMLKKLQKWGETAKRENVQISKHVGHIVSSSGLLSGSTVFVLEFISAPEGKSWAGKMDFCYIASKAFGSSRSFNSEPCDRKVLVYLGSNSTNELISMLEKVPQSVNKARLAESKEALFN